MGRRRPVLQPLGTASYRSHHLLMSPHMVDQVSNEYWTQSIPIQRQWGFGDCPVGRGAPGGGKREAGGISKCLPLCP